MLSGRPSTRTRSNTSVYGIAVYAANTSSAIAYSLPFLSWAPNTGTAVQHAPELSICAKIGAGCQRHLFGSLTLGREDGGEVVSAHRHRSGEDGGEGRGGREVGDAGGVCCQLPSTDISGAESLERRDIPGRKMAARAP